MRSALLITAILLLGCDHRQPAQIAEDYPEIMGHKKVAELCQMYRGLQVLAADSASNQGNLSNITDEQFDSHFIQQERLAENYEKFLRMLNCKKWSPS